MKIVFMGTPDIAVRTLEALINDGHDIAGVFTKVDKPVGRKQILTPPPVKVFAQSRGIPVFQPQTLKENGQATDILKSLNPDVIVVVAYGKILPKEILELPKYGCINGHASILPKYRGSSPIQWCLVCGEKTTGVTTMLMDEGMDTGDILLKSEIEIGENENCEELFERLSGVAAELMCKTLRLLESKDITPVAQEEKDATYAPIIKKEMALMNFRESADTVNNKVRGFYSWPTAYFMLDGKRIKVYKALPAGATEKPPGTVIKADKRLIIACGEGTSLEILELQPEGSKRMTASQMLAGRKINENSVI